MVNAYTLTSEDLFSEVFALAQDEGASDQEMWNDLVDEVIQAHLDLGELNPDQDIEKMKENLRFRFEEFKEYSEDRSQVLNEELRDVGEDNNETIGIN
jgi:predicted xylose isomerase-like sugar epimerase